MEHLKPILAGAAAVYAAQLVRDSSWAQAELTANPGSNMVLFAQLLAGGAVIWGAHKFVSKAV